MINKEVKKQIEGMRFHFDKKESYSVEDVYRMEESFKKVVMREVLNVLDPFVEENSKVIKELEEASSSVKTQMEELTAENKKLTEENAKLNDDLAPVLEAKKIEVAKSRLQGKVVEGAEVDAYGQIDWSALSEEATEEEMTAFVDSSLETLFETKGYLRPAEVKPAGDKAQILKQTNETENENPAMTGNHQDFGYEG